MTWASKRIDANVINLFEDRRRERPSALDLTVVDEIDQLALRRAKQLDAAEADAARLSADNERLHLKREKLKAANRELAAENARLRKKLESRMRAQMWVAVAASLVLAACAVLR